MKKIRWWLGKCLIFTANCRDLEGLAKLRYLCLKDTWKACVRSDCNLSTSLFHACTPPSTMGGLLSFPSLPFPVSLWEGEMALQTHPSRLPSNLISSCHKSFGVGRETRAPGIADTMDNNRGLRLALPESNWKAMHQAPGFSGKCSGAVWNICPASNRSYFGKELVLILPSLGLANSRELHFQ